MSQATPPVAVFALDTPPRSKPSNYPEPFASRMAGREKRALGDVFGLSNFGVNLTRLVPGAGSALRHAHATQDEFLYRSSADVLYLEVGDRSAGDSVSYPDDDLKALFGSDGTWQFVHKDGSPY